VQDSGLRIDLLKPEQTGKGVEDVVAEEEGRSSPRQHWLQKAVQAQAAITVLNGRLRLTLAIN
jgi:hypothetical protein